MVPLTDPPYKLTGSIAWENMGESSCARHSYCSARSASRDATEARQVDLKRPPAVTTVEGDRLRALDDVAVVRTLPSSASGYVSIARSSGVTFGTPKILIEDAQSGDSADPDTESVITAP